MSIKIKSKFIYLLAKVIYCWIEIWRKKRNFKLNFKIFSKNMYSDTLNVYSYKLKLRLSWDSTNILNSINNLKIIKLTSIMPNRVKAWNPITLKGTNKDTRAIFLSNSYLLIKREQMKKNIFIAYIWKARYAVTP